jgi:proton glutamate symport protein
MKKIPLSLQIISAMFIGLFFGNVISMSYAIIDSTADAFVKALQMTVLPYIALSLMVGIGGLSPNKAQQTLKKSTVIIFLMMALVLFFIFIAPMAFPDFCKSF